MARMDHHLPLCLVCALALSSAGCTVGAPPILDAGFPMVDAHRASDAGAACTTVLCGDPASCCRAGDECVLGRCAPPCASAVRCGADGASCCGSGQACISGACVDPGGACTDSFDCPIGEYCEEAIARCIVQHEPVACEISPVFGDLAVVEEWSYPATGDGCTSVYGLPAVIDLDGDSAPEVIFVATDSCAGGAGSLTAVHGRDGSLLFRADPSMAGTSDVAAADLDGDGSPELLAEALDGRLDAFDASGALLWTTTELYPNAVPTIADLDGDGAAEIVLGATVLDARGHVVWTRDLGFERRLGNDLERPSRGSPIPRGHQRRRRPRRRRPA